MGSPTCRDRPARNEKVRADQVRPLKSEHLPFCHSLDMLRLAFIIKGHQCVPRVTTSVIPLTDFNPICRFLLLPRFPCLT